MADSAGITRRNGLKVDFAAQAAWQRRAAQRYAATRRARNNAARLTSSVTKRVPTRNANDWPAAVRKAAARRSGGQCEVCQQERADHLHHRKARRHRDHRIVNALHVCWRCHGSFESPRRRDAYDAGHLVRAGQDPATVPVLIAGARFLPTEDGDWVAAA